MKRAVRIGQLKCFAKNHAIFVILVNRISTYKYLYNQIIFAIQVVCLSSLYLFSDRRCIANSRYSHKGYFKLDMNEIDGIDTITDCACACIDNVNCSAFSFGTEKCFFYEDSLNSTEKVYDTNYGTYIMGKRGLF